RRLGRRARPGPRRRGPSLTAPSFRASISPQSPPEQSELQTGGTRDADFHPGRVRPADPAGLGAARRAGPDSAQADCRPAGSVGALSGAAHGRAAQSGVRHQRPGRPGRVPAGHAAGADDGGRRAPSAGGRRGDPGGRRRAAGHRRPLRAQIRHAFFVAGAEPPDRGAAGLDDRGGAFGPRGTRAGPAQRVRVLHLTVGPGRGRGGWPNTMRTIYMDYAATTPLGPDVLEAMLPWLREGYGNPSSPYAAARLTRAAVDDARVQVAEALDVKPGEVYFTSGGTEALNLAVKGAAFAARKRGRGAHVVVSAVEHQAVLASAAFLERQGFGVTRVPVDEYGVVHPVAVAEALRPDTALVAVMHANNEIGTIQPVEEIARITRARGVPLLVDAVQTAGLLEVRPDDIGCDLLALSAHELYGPKGVGVLYVRTGTKLEPLLHGGGQERGLRAGTENVAGIVGLAAALKKALDHRPGEAARLAGLRDALIDGI